MVFFNRDERFILLVRFAIIVGNAVLAQLVEQRIRNAQVAGSTPADGSIYYDDR